MFVFKEDIRLILVRLLSVKTFLAILFFSITASAWADDHMPPIIAAGFDACLAKGAEEAWLVWGLENAQTGIGQKGDFGTEEKARFLATFSDATAAYGKPLGYELIKRFEVSASYQTVYVL